MANLTRRTFLQTAAAGAAGAALAADRLPNVLLVTSDQESALLPANLPLPNRRRLQDRGVTFTHAFCNTPQCSPARAAILTGRTPLHAGVVTNVDPASLGVAPSPTLPTLASIFRSAGYSTGFFGKWHLGEKGPDQFGFTSSDITSSQSLGLKADEPATRAATTWIGQQKGPWMAWVSLLDPHDIYFPPDGLAAVQPRNGVRAPFSGPDNLEGKPHEQKEFLTRGGRSVTMPTDWIRYRSELLLGLPATSCLASDNRQARGTWEPDQLVLDHKRDRIVNRIPSGNWQCGKWYVIQRSICHDH